MDGAALFVLYQLGTTAVNWLLFREPTRKPLLREYPKVSVLIPARNEESTIGRCLSSVLAQDYPNMEVIVLNDQSSDSTASVIAKYSDPRLKVIAGDRLPEDWTGKNWACHQLYRASSGDILLFIDADTALKNGALTRTVYELTTRGHDFISGIPSERVPSFGEKLTVPFMNYSMFTIFPLILSKLSRHLYMFMVANGQFMMFRRPAYESIGGHQTVKSEIIEDIQLSKLARKKGLRTALYNLRDIISCRMYNGFRDAFLGLAKGYFPIFEMRLIPSLFVWWWMGYLAVHPFLLLTSKDPSAHTNALVAIMGNLALWAATALKTGLPWDVPLYYPVILLVNSVIGYTSILFNLTGKTSWKGRKLSKSRIRLF
ncbi:glycosyltransferase [Coprothermobacteraceae bacterium]|nr:glycosyltransferase [Coprothermobacteraceae bacterium]